MIAQWPAIGSVLPWPNPDDAISPGGSIWDRWLSGHRYSSAYSSARAALAALLAFHGIKRLWLPAYACPALAEGAVGCTLCWYGVTTALVPEMALLEAGLQAGDAVLAIDYFGRGVGAALSAFAACHPDVLWIEDRAQALDPGAADWADVILYSPRKLIGVPDGGVLVGKLALPTPTAAPVPRGMGAQIARAADPEGWHPDTWFPAFHDQEAAFEVDGTPMLGSTKTALQREALAPLAASRRANARHLAVSLPDLALWPDDAVDYAPLAFPIRVAQRDALAAALAERRIYCARHWPVLPSDASHFPLAHMLSAELLSLPCDHRYGAHDMARMVAALRDLRARPA
jgi:hypothetical protein